jgi:hypothetical protein
MTNGSLSNICTLLSWSIESIPVPIKNPHSSTKNTVDIFLEDFDNLAEHLFTPAVNVPMIVPDL